MNVSSPGIWMIHCIWIDDIHGHRIMKVVWMFDVWSSGCWMASGFRIRYNAIERVFVSSYQQSRALSCDYTIWQNPTYPTQQAVGLKFFSRRPHQLQTLYYFLIPPWISSFFFFTFFFEEFFFLYSVLQLFFSSFFVRLTPLGFVCR